MLLVDDFFKRLIQNWQLCNVHSLVTYDDDILYVRIYNLT